MRAVVAVSIVLLAIAALVGSLVLGSIQRQTLACGAGPTTDTATAAKLPAVAGYSGVQLQNAALIIAAGAKAGVSAHGQTLAVMVAAGESGLRALNYGDTAGPDSRGLFQQRASWGSLADRLDPTRSAGFFYQRLTAVAGWQQMAPTRAAHAVQRNADPGYYTPYWPRAQAIVTALTSASSASGSGDAEAVACSSAVGGDPRALAANLVTAIDAGRITGLVPDHLREIRWIAAGETRAGCGVDVRILQVITIALDTFGRVGISDINRHCTGQLLGAGTNSSHWIHGGGEAVDFYSLAGLPTTGADPNAIKLIRTLDPVMPTGARVGQSQCRAGAHDSPALSHLVAFTDTCNHLHVDVAYATGGLDLPDAVAAVQVDRSGSEGAVGAASTARTSFTAGTALRATIRSGPAGRALLGAGSWTVDDFQANRHGADLPDAGLQGAGSGRTIIAMTPHTSTHKDDVPTAPFTTNPLNLLTTTGGSPQLGGFTLQATPQDHLYNGLRVGQATGLRASDIAVTGVPGSANYPPGETFAINDWRTVGSVWTRISVDGAGIGAAGLGANSSRDLTIRDSTFTGLRYSAGLALWQTTGITLDHISVVGNRAGINFERASGPITIRDSTFANNDKYDLQFMTDQAGGDVTIIDPVLAPGQQLRIHLPGRYSGQPNGQDRARIHVLTGGVDVTDRTIDWV